VVSKDQSQHSLNGIYCHPKFTVGCDGKMLLIVTAPKPNIEDMPTPPGEELTNEFMPFILDLVDAQKIEKSIPRKPSFPILKHVGIIKTGENSECTKIFTTDLQNQNILISRQMGYEYPKFGKAFPKGKPIKTVRVQTKLLSNLINAIEKAQGETKTHYVDIQIYDEEKPIKLTSYNQDTYQKITGILMPMKK
jgi:hypothetical protein